MQNMKEEHSFSQIRVIRNYVNVKKRDKYFVFLTITLICLTNKINVLSAKFVCYVSEKDLTSS